jgi:hypothetical protein
MSMNLPSVKPERNRKVVCGIIRALRIGSGWKDCLAEHGPGTTIRNRLSTVGAYLHFSVLLSFVGCTQYVQYWGRAGGNDDALAATSASCVGNSWQRLPPVTFGRPGFYPNPLTHCVPTAGGLNCTLINPGYLPQATAAADTNAPPRAAAFQNCMMAAGWRPLGVAADGRVYLPPNAPEARGK